MYLSDAVTPVAAAQHSLDGRMNRLVSVAHQCLKRRSWGHSHGVRGATTLSDPARAGPCVYWDEGPVGEGTLLCYHY